MYKHVPTGTETARGKSYTTNVLMTALGISRGTLRYYEQIGLINPSRDPDSNYRSYSNADLFTIVESVLLKSAGYQAGEASEIVVDDAESAGDFVETCISQNEMQRQRAEAISARLESLRELVNADLSAPPRLVLMDEWLILYDGAEGGYDRFRASDAQDSLLDGMPVSAFAAVIDIDVFHPSSRVTRWGRSYPLSCGHLFPRLQQYANELFHCGAKPCLMLPYSADWNKIPGFDEDGSVCRRFAEKLREGGLKPAGPVIAPDVLPVRGRVYSHLYLPVEAASAKGRVMIALAKRE